MTEEANGLVVPDAALRDRAIALAEHLVERARAVETSAQRKQSQRLARMLADPRGKPFMLGLTDRVVRVREPRRAAGQLTHVLDTVGIPSFLGPVDASLLRAGAALAPIAPAVVMPLVADRLRRETGRVLVPAESEAFARHAASRRADGVRLNVNVLGEAILGEEEATRRLEAVLGWLSRPDVDYVSVKISAICSQLSSLAFDDTVSRIAERLRVLYTAAARTSPAKFVNLDMEEHRDLELTLAVFRRVLDEDDFAGLDAGIVLQAYLPDAVPAAEQLVAWASARYARGGGRIKVRVVKGANLAMEQVEAELHGWAQAPYTTKAEVDANYKRLLDALLVPAAADALRVGVATHNVFDAAWAIVLGEALGALDRIDMEMLEGMADAQAAAIVERVGSVLLYAPLARRDDFESAIAYLVRRLDENTGPENYLRHSLGIQPDSAAFIRERQRFVAAVRDRHTVATGPRRTQDRSTEAPDFDRPFVNEPDTDFSLPANRRWVEIALEAWSPPAEVAPVIDGEVVADAALPREPVVDPGRPGIALTEVALADAATVDRALAAAAAAQPSWAARPSEDRRAVLRRVAEAMARHRGDTIATMAVDAGKTVAEADPEVSEAIDFACYYAERSATIDEVVCSGIEFRPHGVVVVTSPWNFPYAIPAGGVFAALAAGNSVILKPAPETRLTASLLARHCWEGGVPHGVLQFLPCPDDDVGRRLVTSDAVGAVVLTGAWETAKLFQGWKPDLRLFAETSGKNAIVVTATADLDAAVRDIVRSAFGHAGQKCSAASLAIVEHDVYDDPRFVRQLRDAVASLAVGPGWDVRTTVGPVIRPPEGALAHALTTLDPGEEWLVEPRVVDGNPHMWSPGVKTGVRPGSPFHRTECFGPVLGVMRAADLDDAIQLQNATPFGLTGGIHALDPREVDRWLEGVEVGNAYVNRHITGAIVGRQPFGGWKRSAVGPSFKAGGPNAVFAMGRFVDSRPRPDAATWAEQVEHAWASEFGVEHDPTGLRAERNVFRYRPFRKGIVLRVADGDAGLVDASAAAVAARRSGTPVVVSAPVAAAGVDVVESEDDLAARLRRRALDVDRVSVLGPASAGLREACLAAEITVDDAPFVAHARVELLRWVREQAVSITMHRHGNVVPTRGHR